MLKKITLTGIALSALLLSGCGGGSDNNENVNPMNNKEVIVILRDVSPGICESAEYRNLLSVELIGVLTEEKPNTVTCADYGKKDDRIECTVEYYTEAGRGNVACVVGADGLKNNAQARVVDSSYFATTVHTKLIQLAE